MDIVGIGQIPKTIYRVGRRDLNKTRILKVEFPTSYTLWAVMRERYKLIDTKFKDIQIFPESNSFHKNK